MEKISRTFSQIIASLIDLSIHLGNFIGNIYFTLADFFFAITPFITPNLTIAAVAGGFTIFFSWRRIGYKVGAIYSDQMNRLTASGISSVTLLNYKDRPIPIFSLDVILGERSLNLKKFEPPIILKPLEVTSIEIDPVSAYYDKNGKIDLNSKTTDSSQVEFYISTTDKNIKCIQKGPCDHWSVIKKRKLGIISKSTVTYCGHIISDKILYAVHYMDGKKHEVSFIDKSGYISWDVFPNLIELDDYKGIKEIEDTLKQSTASKIYTNIAVVEIER
jgi:hypothetical protein